MDYVNIAGLVFGFIGSAILGLGMIRSKDRIEKESGSFWDGNPYTEGFYRLDRVKGLWGMGTLAVGFFLQILSVFI